MQEGTFCLLPEAVGSDGAKSRSLLARLPSLVIMGERGMHDTPKMPGTCNGSSPIGRKEGGRGQGPESIAGSVVQPMAPGDTSSAK